MSVWEQSIQQANDAVKDTQLLCPVKSHELLHRTQLALKVQPLVIHLAKKDSALSWPTCSSFPLLHAQAALPAVILPSMRPSTPDKQFILMLSNPGM